MLLNIVGIKVLKRQQTHLGNTDYIVTSYNSHYVDIVTIYIIVTVFRVHASAHMCKILCLCRHPCMVYIYYRSIFKKNPLFFFVMPFIGISVYELKAFKSNHR